MVQQTRPLTDEDIHLLETTAKKIKGRREYCRLQSVLYRAKEGKTAKEISQLLGIHERTVEKHHQRYFAEGLAAFKAKKTGTTGPRLLQAWEEAELFASLTEEGAQGQLVNATKIKAKFEEKIGKPCATSTIYLVIHRNNWSKKQPRPRHPKGDEEAKCLFKKTI